MTTAPPSPPPGMPPSVPPKKGLSGCAIAGIGCGIAAVLGLIIVIVLIVAGGYWFAREGPAFLKNTMVQEIQTSPLPPDEQQVFIDRIEQLTDDYEAGAIDFQQYGEALGQISVDLETAIQQHQSGGGTTAPAQPGAPADAAPAP